MTRQWTRGQWALRSVIAVGAVGALAASGLAGAAPPLWMVVLVLAISLGAAVYPDSGAGAGALVIVVAWWGVGLEDGLHPAALLASAGLVAAHVAATVADLGPGSVPLDRAVLLRWSLRGLLVWLSTPVLWGTAVLVRDQPAPSGVWLAGLGAALVGLLVANLLLTRRPG